MAQARPGEDVRSHIGRFVVLAVAAAIAALMVWALFDAARRTPGVEAAAASPTKVAVASVPAAAAALTA